MYLDSAASALKPRSVVDRLSNYYLYESSNVHRGSHYLSDQGTSNYENSREKVRGFINADSCQEIIFTKGTTESINLVAQSWGYSQLKQGDEILLTEMEHHSNIVPWQILAEKVGAVIKVLPIVDERGNLCEESFERLLSEKTKMVAITHCSNTLGTINDIERIVKKAKAIGAKVLVDGAQAVCCQKVDVKKLDCDFYAFSGHKLWGPYGIGVLYGKKDILNEMPPYQSGGSMISEVSFLKTTFGELPNKFEGGTPHIAGAIGLSEAIDYTLSVGIEAIHSHGEMLLKEASEGLKAIDGLRVIGEAEKKTSLISFVIEGVHHSDLGQILDEQGVAIRTGHHCTQPLMEKLGLPGTTRASFSMYNTRSDVEALIEGVKKSVELLR